MPFAARATRRAFLILEGAVAAAMGCGGCIASCCWGPSQENLKIDYDRLVNVPWNCTVLSGIPFIDYYYGTYYHGIIILDTIHCRYHS